MTGALLRNHWPALCFSIFAGLVIVAPQLFFIQSLGTDYKGLYMLNTDAEPHYLARMQAAVKGDGIGNPFVIDGRNDVPSSFYSYSESLLAVPAQVFPISIPTLNLVYKFLLPVILALLAYALALRLGASRGWSIAAAVALTLGSTLLNASSALSLLRADLIYQQFLLFSRPVSPVLYEVFLLAFLHVLITCANRKTRRWYALLGALFGLSWYFYIYLATLIGAILGSIILIELISKRFQSALHHVSSLAFGLLIGAPAIYSLYAITQSPYYGLFVGPIGLEHTHAPYLHIPWLVVTALFALFWYFNRSYQHASVLASLLLAAFVVANQQVLTGLSLHPGHYITYFCIPLYIIVLTAIAGEYFKTRLRLVGSFIKCLVVAYVVVGACFIQYSSYAYWAPRTVTMQRDSAPLSWLNEHAPAESVVMANHTLSELIPAYTKSNVMWEVHANTYLMPERRWNFTPEHALAAKDFCAFIREYRLDYVLWDRQNDPDWSISRKPCLHQEAEMEGFIIYSTP